MPTKQFHASMRRADDLLDGTLKTKLYGWRKHGCSWEEVARLLRTVTKDKVAITGATASRWAARLGVK